MPKKISWHFLPFQEELPPVKKRLPDFGSAQTDTWTRDQLGPLHSTVVQHEPSALDSLKRQRQMRCGHIALCSLSTCLISFLWSQNNTRCGSACRAHCQVIQSDIWTSDFGRCFFILFSTSSSSHSWAFLLPFLHPWPPLNSGSTPESFFFLKFCKTKAPSGIDVPFVLHRSNFLITQFRQFSFWCFLCSLEVVRWNFFNQIILFMVFLWSRILNNKHNMAKIVSWFATQKLLNRVGFGAIQRGGSTGRSRILVRGASGVLTPGGPWTQKLLKIAWKLHDFNKIVGAGGGPGPQAPWIGR